MTRFEMTPEDVELATWLGRARQAENTAAGVRENRGDGGHCDPELLHIIGAKPEIEFARRAGVPPDLTTTPRAGTPDFRFKFGTIDIKTPMRPGLNLVVRNTKTESSADFYVLAELIADNIVNFVGYARSPELINKNNLRNLGHNNIAYFLSRHQLHPFDELLGWARVEYGTMCQCGEALTLPESVADGACLECRLFLKSASTLFRLADE